MNGTFENKNIKFQLSKDTIDNSYSKSIYNKSNDSKTKEKADTPLTSVTQKWSNHSTANKSYTNVNRTSTEVSKACFFF